jgi:hypothetical protein
MSNGIITKLAMSPKERNSFRCLDVARRILGEEIQLTRHSLHKSGDGWLEFGVCLEGGGLWTVVKVFHKDNRAVSVECRLSTPTSVEHHTCRKIGKTRREWLWMRFCKDSYSNFLMDQDFAHVSPPEKFIRPIDNIIKMVRDHNQGQMLHAFTLCVGPRLADALTAIAPHYHAMVAYMVSLGFENPELIAKMADKLNGFGLPLVRRVYPQLISHKLSAVQPMSGPNALIYHMRSKVKASP